jgi:hypothetical protein
MMKSLGRAVVEQLHVFDCFAGLPVQQSGSILLHVVHTFALDALLFSL